MITSSSSAHISCPACDTQIPLSQALESELRQQLDLELTQEREALAMRVSELTTREERLSKEQSKLDQLVEKKLRSERKQLLAEARQEVREELSVELEDQAGELESLREQLKATQAAELKLRKQERELKQQAESLELEVARRVDEEATNIRKQAVTDANEAHRLKQAENELKIEGLLRKIDELKQRAEQGSVQLQGEVLELDVEEMLSETFPQDKIEEVAKGANGADITQTVVTSGGQPCGTLLWETKRTKNWSANWIPKLKDDQRNSGAAAAIIVSKVLPDGIDTIGCIDGVWVCSRACAQGLAAVLRSNLQELHRSRIAQQGLNDKQELIYRYLASPAFQGRVSGIVESFVALQEDLSSEKRAMQRRWSKREKQLERAVNSATGLCGDIEGIVGAEHANLEAAGLLRLEDGSAA